MEYELTKFVIQRQPYMKVIITHFFTHGTTAFSSHDACKTMFCICG